MATRIIEYGGRAAGDYPVIPASQFVKKQTAMTATATSERSSSFDAATRLVIVDSDEQVYVELGANPTATTDNLRIPAGGRAEFDVPVNQAWKVAVRT
jgi:hypothetical protein